jgi:hypothetical protein
MGESRQIRIRAEGEAEAEAEAEAKAEGLRSQRRLRVKGKCDGGAIHRSEGGDREFPIACANGAPRMGPDADSVGEEQHG